MLKLSTDRVLKVACEILPQQLIIPLKYYFMLISAGICDIGIDQGVMIAGLKYWNILEYEIPFHVRSPICMWSFWPRGAPY